MKRTPYPLAAVFVQEERPGCSAQQSVDTFGSEQGRICQLKRLQTLNYREPQRLEVRQSA